ncbi:Transmembrane protein [Parasponia andersonii]|uniref:Transmembrane protein n=1 Tax=Parasponia andersonii TaxID=3476 RepID=A0A2P5C233_PARAD|nr:Transmembrane protein [Parasponia andersonii]
MGWFYPKRRGPQWKQGWTSQTVASVSAPSFHLLAIFSIVMVLLWLSQYTGHKAQLQQTAVNFQLFVFLLPVLLIVFMASYSSCGLFNFRFRRPRPDTPMQPAGSSPWGVAVFVALLLVLLSYQSSFHSKWFGPLWSSD